MGRKSLRLRLEPPVVVVYSLRPRFPMWLCGFDKQGVTKRAPLKINSLELSGPFGKFETDIRAITYAHQGEQGARELGHSKSVVDRCAEDES